MEALQQALSVLLVLGLLGGTLFWLRRKGLARFGVRGMGRASDRQMQCLERLPLTPQHSLHLVRVAGKVLLIAVSPGGCSVLEGAGWEGPAVDRMVSR
jgi:flagellar biogenesis protein FliO